MISIRSISKKFGTLQVLDQVSLDFTAGQSIAIIGPNGCGKTTLIKSILGMVLPDAGDILYKNQSVRAKHLYKKEIGYMPQIGNYPEHMTIGHVLQMINDMRLDTDQMIDNELYELFQIDKLKQKKMYTLSGGTTQKVSATLAFLFDPHVLILDEPTAGLDPLASEILRQKIIASQQNGKLIILTSHVLSELDDLITHIVFMQEGKISFYKSVKELIQITGEQKISKAIAAILKKNTRT